MRDPIMKSLLAENKVQCIRLTVAKRRVPQNCGDYLRGDAAKKHVNQINRHIFLYRYFDTRFELKRGDVFLAYFEYTCGCEVDGPHFVVALQTSGELNQLVTVVPLSSYKNDRELNPASELFIGKIPGVANGKETIAIINQIKTIDKRRLYDKAAVEHFNNYAKFNEIQSYQLLPMQRKYIYRLTDEQFDKIKHAILDYLTTGYIRHG